MRMSLLLVAVILSILALTAPGASAQEGTASHCYATTVAPITSQVTIYVSQLMPMEVSQQLVLDGLWSSFVRAAYPREHIVESHCERFGPNAAMQQRAIAAEEALWSTRGYSVVHVTMGTMGPGNSAPAESIYAAAPGPAGVGARVAPSPEAPVASQAAEPSASYCFSDERKPTMYFSDAFDTAGMPTSAAWSTPFKAFLAQKYGYSGQVTCKSTDTIVSAQRMIRNQREGLPGKEFIETDWTYEPPAPGDSNPAAPAATPTPPPA